MTVPDAHLFSAVERERIRNEFMVRFGFARALDDGMLLKRWASGPQKGQIKLGKADQSMVGRGLIEVIDDGKPWPVAQFTALGMRALQALAADQRQLDPTRFAHLLADIARLHSERVSLSD